MIQVYAIIILVALSTGSLGSWYFTRMYYANQILETQQKASEALQEASEAYIVKIQEGIEEHDKNQAVINDLSNQLSKRVRIKVPTCTSAAEASKDTDGRGRIFSERADESFRRFEQRMEELAKRCDQLNNDAIRSNTTAE